MKSLLRNFEEWLAGTFLVLMSAATFGNVISRYLFNAPIEWAEEFSRYSFIWVVFLGAVVCAKHGRHITIDMLVLALPDAWRAALRVFVHLCVMALMVVIAYYGTRLTMNATQITATLGIRQYWIYAVVPLSAVLIFLHCVRDLRRDLSVLIGRNG